MNNDDTTGISRFDKITQTIEKVHMRFTITLFAILLVVLTIGVIARNSGIPIMWVDELAKILFIWQTFLSAALAVWQGGHLALDLFKKYIDKFRILVIGLNVFSIIILAAFIKPALQIIEIGATSFTSLLLIPWSYLYVPFLIFILLSIMYHVFGIIKSFKTR